MINKLKNISKNHLVLYIISLVVVIVDQLTKFLVVTNMNIANEIEIIHNFFSIFYVTNTGAAFSSFRDQTTLLIIVSIFCIAIINAIIQREKFNYKLSVISLGLLLGGMIGNLIDRVIYKNVIDFLSFNIFGYKFPVFNIADICITLGVFIYIGINLVEEIREKKKKIWYNIHC